MRARHPITLLSFVALTIGCSEDDAPPATLDQGGGPGGGATSSSTAVGSGPTSSAGGSTADGGGGGGGAEGGGGEGGQPAEPTTIEVVDQNDEPAIGFDVLINDETGTLVMHGVTDVDGKLTAVVPPQGSVSVLFSEPYTVGGEDYIDRNIYSTYFPSTAPPSVRVRYFAPGQSVEPNDTAGIWLSYPAKPGAALYEVKTSCINAQTSSTAYAYANVPGCTGDDLYDILVVARGTDGALLDYVSLPDQSFVPGLTNLQFLSWSSQPVGNISFNIENIPTSALTVAASTRAELDAHGAATQIYNSWDAELPPNEVELTLPHASAFGNRHCETAWVKADESAVGSTWLETRRCSPQADLSPFSWNASRLARFEIDATTARTGTIAWTESWPGEAGDALLVYSLGGEGNTSVRWRAVVQPGAGALTPPSIPPALADYALPTGDTLGSVELHHVDSSELDGFDAFVVEGYTFGPGEVIYEVLYP